MKNTDDMISGHEISHMHTCAIILAASYLLPNELHPSQQTIDDMEGSLIELCRGDKEMVSDMVEVVMNHMIRTGQAIGAISTDKAPPSHCPRVSVLVDLFKAGRINPASVDQLGVTAAEAYAEPVIIGFNGTPER